MPKLDDKIYVYEGELWQVGLKDLRKVHFVLFEDSIMLGIRKNDETEFRELLNLLGARCHPYSDRSQIDFWKKQYGFSLITSARSFVVFAEGEVEYQVWMDRIGKVLGNLNKKNSQEITLAPILGFCF